MAERGSLLYVRVGREEPEKADRAEAVLTGRASLLSPGRQSRGIQTRYTYVHSRVCSDTQTPRFI